jgi:hypothetical protein
MTDMDLQVHLQPAGGAAAVLALTAGRAAGDQGALAFFSEEAAGESGRAPAREEEEEEGGAGAGGAGRDAASCLREALLGAGTVKMLLGDQVAGLATVPGAGLSSIYLSHLSALSMWRVPRTEAWRFFGCGRTWKCAGADATARGAGRVD